MGGCLRNAFKTVQTSPRPLGRGLRPFWVPLPPLALAVITVLATAHPLVAQSDRPLNFVVQRYVVTGNCCEGGFPIKPGTYSRTPASKPEWDWTQVGAGASTTKPPDSRSEDPNRGIYYKNKLEFSLEGGWLPINIPFPFDFLLGDGYNFPGLYYTLVPIIASVRWQIDDVRGPWILRGNWDVTFSGSVTAIPRGAETRYFSYIMGIRRNFVPRRWKVAPYVDGRLGLGEIDAKGPLGVAYAQGQNFTFTLNLGSGMRYNLNSRYGLEVGMHYMHISNLYLSEPKFLNYGINVYGPWAGINVRLGKR